MIQILFFALLIVTLLGGFFAYHAPSQSDPVKFMMDSTGYNSMETTNRKKFEQINIVTNKGLMEIRRQMDDLALEQSKFLDTIQDQQQILKNTNKDASDILLLTQQKGVAGKDILQLQALTSEMQNQQRLLVDHGHDLIALNDQLTKNRQLMAEQINLANINTESSLHALQQHSAALNNQAAEIFDKVAERNQEVRDQMEQMQSRLKGIADNTAYDSADQQQRVKEGIQGMLDKEHEDMLRLTDSEQRNKDLLQDAKERQADAKELLNERLQQNKDMIEEERQKEQDQKEQMQGQQSMIQQRIADQRQQMQDQQNR